MKNKNCPICKCLLAVSMDVTAAISAAYLTGKYGADPKKLQRLGEALEVNEPLIKELMSDMKRKMHETIAITVDVISESSSTAQGGTLQ